MEVITGDDGEWSPRRLVELEKIHADLVIGEADKESGMYTFTCRNLYNNFLHTNVETADSGYAYVGEVTKELDGACAKVLERHYEWARENNFLPPPPSPPPPQP